MQSQNHCMHVNSYVTKQYYIAIDIMSELLIPLTRFIINTLIVSCDSVPYTIATPDTLNCTCVSTLSMCMKGISACAIYKYSFCSDIYVLMYMYCHVKPNLKIQLVNIPIYILIYIAAAQSSV